MMRNQNVKNIIIGLLAIGVVVLGIANYQSHKELEICKEALSMGEDENERLATAFTAGHNFFVVDYFYMNGEVTETKFRSIERMVDDFFDNPTYDKAYQIMIESTDEIMDATDRMLDKELN